MDYTCIMRTRSASALDIDIQGIKNLKICLFYRNYLRVCKFE